MRHALRLRHMVAAFAAVSLTAVAGAAGQPLAQRTLHVTSGANGTVTSADRRIDCGARCSSSYERGTVVTLRASARRLFAFARWTGGCVGTAPTCIVAVDRTLTVRAVFARKRARVTLSVGGPGRVVSTPTGIDCGKDGGDCEQSFPAGTSVRLSPTPAAGGAFQAWPRGCGTAGQGTCTFVAGGAREVLAAFRHEQPDSGDQTLFVSADSGQVTSSPAGIECPPACEATFPNGTVVVLRGSSDWTGGCVGSARSCALVLDVSDGVGSRGSDVPELGVSVSVSGPGLVSATDRIRCGGTTGTIFDCEALYPRGTTVVLRATVVGRGRFVRWGGFCTGRRRSCTLRVTAPKDVQALFRR